MVVRNRKKNNRHTRKMLNRLKVVQQNQNQGKKINTDIVNTGFKNKNILSITASNDAALKNKRTN